MAAAFIVCGICGMRAFDLAGGLEVAMNNYPSRGLGWVFRYSTIAADDPQRPD
jgi:hypothetical protein